MKEQLILLAKEKGFSSDIISDKPWKYSFNEGLRYLFFMTNLQKWLREVHGIHISIWFNILTEKYRPESSNDELDNILSVIIDKIGEFDTYELTLEVGLEKALKLIKDEFNNN
jgi:hypothetical protein